jgi:pimeloyl-ACP methyl ester carboxylesterase
VPSARVNGINISYADTGRGPAVLMIMGTGARGRVWSAHQVPTLSDAGFRVVTFENRGTPPSDECVDGFELADLTTDTVALVEELGLGPCHVVGTSLGATIAQEVAGHRPDLVSSLVLLATRRRPDAFRRQLALAERELHESGIRLPDRYRAVVEALQNLSPRTLADDEAVLDWLDVLAVNQAGERRGSRIQMDIGDSVDRTAAAAAIGCRTLVVAFADDVVNPPSLCAQVAEAVPGSRFEVVEGCGHYGYLERPDEINRLIIEFLKE